MLSGRERDTDAERECRSVCLEQGVNVHSAVKYSAGPLPEGCEPLLLMSIFRTPLLSVSTTGLHENSTSQHFELGRAMQRAPFSGRSAFPKVKGTKEGVGVLVAQQACCISLDFGCGHGVKLTSD